MERIHASDRNVQGHGVLYSPLLQVRRYWGYTHGFKLFRPTIGNGRSAVYSRYVAGGGNTAGTNRPAGRPRKCAAQPPAAASRPHRPAPRSPLTQRAACAGA